MEGTLESDSAEDGVQERSDFLSAWDIVDENGWEDSSVPVEWNISSTDDWSDRCKGDKDDTEDKDGNDNSASTVGCEDTGVDGREDVITDADGGANGRNTACVVDVAVDPDD